VGLLSAHNMAELKEARNAIKEKRFDEALALVNVSHLINLKDGVLRLTALVW
jgi:hypothetical protein